MATRVAKMAMFRLIGRSDYARWTDLASLESWWEPRMQRLAAMVPAGTRVIEFGAGRRRLPSFLDASCTYVASDLVDRGPATFLCDLNHRPLPDLATVRPEVAVFAGVLEYVRDLPAVVEWLSAHVRYCVASYAVVRRSGLREDLYEGVRRIHHGYMNSYDEMQLISVFSRSGFACVRTESWNEQGLFLFQRSLAIPTTAAQPAGER